MQNDDMLNLENLNEYGCPSAELRFNLANISNIKSFFEKYDEQMLKNRNISDYLKLLLRKKGLKVANVVVRSGLDRKYVYQIFKGTKNPSRDKLIAIAFGLGLSDEETQKMLKVSGNRELYVRDKRDTLILFSIQRKKDIMITNELLAGYGFPPLY